MTRHPALRRRGAGEGGCFVRSKCGIISLTNTVNRGDFLFPSEPIVLGQSAPDHPVDAPKRPCRVSRTDGQGRFVVLQTVARTSKVGFGPAGFGKAGQGRAGKKPSWLGRARSGKVRQGQARSGKGKTFMVGKGKVRSGQAGQIWARLGEAWQGKNLSRLGQVWLCSAWLSVVRLGLVGQGKAWKKLPWRGLAQLGRLGRGTARHGSTWRGN